MPKTDPVRLFCADAVRAGRAADPLARRCFLATSEADGHPAVRTLVLRGVEENHIELYFSATSAKWRGLLGDARYELLTYWPILDLQYRLRGGFEPIPRERMVASWQQKSAGGKLLDLYYADVEPQGSRLDRRQALEAALQSIRRRTGNASRADAPGSLVGLSLEPKVIERLDLSAEAGIPVRDRYVREALCWRRQHLVP